MGLSSSLGASASSSSVASTSFLPAANAPPGAPHGFVAAAAAQVSSIGASWTSSTNASLPLDSNNPNQNNGLMRPRGTSGEALSPPDSRQFAMGASAGSVKYGANEALANNLNDGPLYANVAVKRSFEAPEYANVNVHGSTPGDALLRGAAGSATTGGGLTRYSMDLERATVRKPSGGSANTSLASPPSSASSQALLDRSRAAAQTSPGTAAPGSTSAPAAAADAQSGSRKSSATEKTPDNVRQALAKQVSHSISCPLFVLFVSWFCFIPEHSAFTFIVCSVSASEFRRARLRSDFHRRLKCLYVSFEYLQYMYEVRICVLQ